MGKGSQKEVYLKKKKKKQKKTHQKNPTFLKRKINKKFLFPSMLCDFLFFFPFPFCLCLQSL